MADSGAKELWARFGQVYYLVNALALLCYPVVRVTHGTSRLDDHDTWSGLSREQEVLAMVALLLLVRLRRTVSWEEFAEKVLLFGKTAVVLLMYYMSPKYAIWYAVLVVALYLLVRPQGFEGEQHVTELDPLTFDTKVRRPEDFDRKVAWLVMFTASWCEKGTYVYPNFAALSNKYSGPYLQFGTMDLAKFESYGEDYSIDMGGTTSQIPTMILFYKGVEVRRLPQFDSKGEVAGCKFDMKTLTKFFELDAPYNELTYRKFKKKKTG